MVNWKDIPDLYKGGVVLVALTVFVLTYHDRFITEAEAMEQQQKNDQQIKVLIVLNFEDKLTQRIKEKVKAVEAGDMAEAERLEQDIQTIRDRIKSLCENLEEC